MAAFALPPGLARHTPQLWGAVVKLCSAGFTVDPYEARVLFADFGIEAWQELAADYPQLGTKLTACSFERVLTRQFYNYAATSLVSLSAARWRLRDMQTVLMAPPCSSPAGAWRVLAEALAHLPENDVERLLAFRTHGLPCEWLFAAADGGTIRNARAALVQAATRWVDLSFTLDPQGEQPAIARALWSHGRHAASVARQLGLPLAQVEAARMDIGINLASALDHATPKRRSKGRTALANDYFSDFLVLLARSNRSEVHRFAARFSTHLLEQLDDNDLQLNDEARQIAEMCPEVLAQAYYLLLKYSFKNQDDRDSCQTEHAWQLHQRATQHVAAAFDALVTDLPPEMVDWSRLLPRDVVGRFDTTVPAPAESRHASALRRYGLVPESFVGIARSLQLQFDALRNRNTVPAFFAADDAPDTPEPTDEPVTMGFKELQACVRAAPHVPGHAGLVDALAHWTLEVVAERPHFVPGYASDRSSSDEGALVAVPRTSALAVGVQDLRALWIARRPGVRQMVASW
ncbi:MAG: hypothetical protein AB3X44_13075 [Leptothrix sp. (in: b-proteobacteria)]